MPPTMHVNTIPPRRYVSSSLTAFELSQTILHIAIQLEKVSYVLNLLKFIFTVPIQ